MDNEIKTYLFDIKESISEIESYFENRKLDFFEFLNDTKTKRAIERNLEIIGEAVNRILKIDSQINLSSSRNIVDVRNRIIHNYDNISYEVIWGIIIKYIPILKSEIVKILDD
jgi:uncharacterized protein with HEPN domain